jgi:hypothetical protein
MHFYASSRSMERREYRYDLECPSKNTLLAYTAMLDADTMNGPDAKGTPAKFSQNFTDEWMATQRRLVLGNQLWIAPIVQNERTFSTRNP